MLLLSTWTVIKDKLDTLEILFISETMEIYKHNIEDDTLYSKPTDEQKTCETKLNCWTWGEYLRTLGAIAFLYIEDDTGITKIGNIN